MIVLAASFEWFEILGYLVMALVGGGLASYRFSKKKAPEPTKTNGMDPHAVSKTMEAEHAETDAEIRESDARANEPVGGEPVPGSDAVAVDSAREWLHADNDD